MHHKIKFKYIAILMLSVLLNFYSFECVALDKINTQKIILVDPGHGGIDGGAVSPTGTIEKDINLSISKKLKSNLEKKGFKVIMTREEDLGLYSDKGRIRDKKNEDLNNRCKMKKDSNCDMFISVHLNMFQQRKYYGAQVWYEKSQESNNLAHIAQQNLIKDLNNKNNRKAKCAKGSYKILRCSCDIPSILVECGFLSNYEEEKLLKTDNYQEKIAKSLADSIEQYFNSEQKQHSEDSDEQQINEEKNDEKQSNGIKRIWDIFTSKMHR